MMEREAHRNYGPRDPYAPPERREFRVPVIATEVVKLSEKVMFPVDEYPRYNFIGKILGPKGSTLKGLQATTKCKMSILGRGSTKDKRTEEELSKSDHSQHEHLKESLHVLIQVQAPKIEAHRRLAAGLREIQRFMVPVDDTMMPDQMDDRLPYHNEHEGGRAGGSRYHNEHEGGRAGGSRDDAFAPIIRVGIPPPGALIIGEEPPRNGGRPHRESRRGPPADGYDGYEAPRKGYSENRGRYDKFSRTGEKRSAPSDRYPMDRYRDSY